MNEQKARKIRKSLDFYPQAKRTYTKDPRTGSVHANVERKRYQKAKKEI